MTTNMGVVDRVIRTVAAVVIAALYFSHVIGGTIAIILGLVAVLFLVTSLVGWCPGYVPFGFSTLRRAPTPAAKS